MSVCFILRHLHRQKQTSLHARVTILLFALSKGQQIVLLLLLRGPCYCRRDLSALSLNELYLSLFDHWRLAADICPKYIERRELSEY